ncbi:MAG: PrsW family intramembrane metalloprotease [Actinomycetota bacterium]|nr:PrsW family intramembrane metalloprotease [Actinomycetota bacterium]HZY64541.1 PrsW family intramembrane metalloprotease [Rubrobacteraceae bacterium]
MAELSAPLVGFGIVQAMLYVFFIRFVDAYERESLLYVIPVFVWGFTVAVFIALVFNALFAFTVTTISTEQAASFLTAVVGAPVIEECAKGLALLIAFAIAYAIARRRGAIEFSGVMDGIVYGSAVGFGFAIAEDLLYYVQAGPETFVVRRIFGGFAHAAFTSLTGIGIGLIPWVRFRFLKVLLPMLGLTGAIMLHALFNFTATLLGPLVYLGLFAVTLFYISLIVLWLAVERRIIRSELRDEVSVGTITSEEYEILPTYFRRKAFYLRLISSGRLGAWRRARKAHKTAVDLAFTKRLARSTRAAPQGSRAAELRRKIQTARGPSASPAS